MRVPRVVGPATIAACLGALAGVLVASSSEAPVVAGRIAAAPPVAPAVVEGDWPVPTLPPAPVHPTSFLVADAAGPSVPVWDDPAAPGPSEELANPTWEGLAVVFRVLEDRGDGWLHVRVSTRPNGRTAWVRAEDVTLRQVPNWIRVELGAKRLTVFHGDTALMSTTVAVGRPETPTPTGSFFVDGVVPLDPPHRAYGAGQVSVSGFSEVHRSFGGGVGQIALHGTLATGLLGQPTSNGCVRLDNDSIRQVMYMAPTGTPVQIVP